MTVSQIVQSSTPRPRAFSPLSLSRLHQLVGSLVGAGGWARRVATALLLPLILLAAWSLVARYELVAPQILPGPSIVWATAIDLIASGQLQSPTKSVTHRTTLTPFAWPQSRNHLT